MTALKHIGIRPIYPLIVFKQGLRAIHGHRYEVRPDGSWRLWSDRMLRSGCNYIMTDIIIENDLIYCSKCGEFFSLNQFTEVD